MIGIFRPTTKFGPHLRRNPVPTVVFVNISDGLSFYDILSITSQVSIADLLALSDAFVAAPCISIADSLSLSDAVTREFLRIIADALSLSETLAITAQVPIADAVHLVDSPQLTVNIPVADALALSDSGGVLKDWLIAITDTISVLDSLTSILVYIPISDAIYLVDLIYFRKGFVVVYLQSIIARTLELKSTIS